MTYTDNPSFDDTYWAAQSPEVQSLRTINDQATRTTHAMMLATQGFIIDDEIMILGWDPWKVMSVRQNFGFTWVPNVLQPNVEIIPGITDWKHTPYDPSNPPLRSIRVSTNPADYPPFIPPPPPPPPASGTWVGKQVWQDIYAVVPGDPTPNGVQVTEPRGTFLKHQLLPGGPMGSEAWYEKIG